MKSKPHYIAVLSLPEPRELYAQALKTESGKVRKIVKSYYKNGKFIIISNSYSHFRAALITAIKLIKMLQSLEKFLRA
jgi:hypothetical protein